ncbi:MAG: amidohydrolase family protein [Acidimicrobiia bacterium]|nr:amidohydrolase family protein [Acidimicrobiia bacterium]
MRTVVANGVVLDTLTMSMVGERDVVIEDGSIVAVVDRFAGDADFVVDARNRYVVPGLIDGHVHFRLATMDFRKLASMTEVEFGIRMATLARQTVERGFTTVRDLGGDVTGLLRAIASGIATGPRIVRAGRMLTQTGGHGDVEGGEREVPDCACSMRSTVFGIVADGPDAVRTAARHNLRDGSDFLKVHVSGGVASPSDPLESLQYTHEELAVAVTEARHRNTYVAAHAYTPESIAQAVGAGVFTIEHGNLIDEPTAALMASEDSVLVPTLSTYHAMQTLGADLGLPQKNRDKNSIVYEAGLTSLELARRAGVSMAYGTDLIGETQTMQNGELAIRSEVLPATEILHSMWITTARLCGLEGRIGVIAPGAYGDLLVSRVDPLLDLAAFAEPENSISHVIQSGRPVVDR